VYAVSDKNYKGELDIYFLPFFDNPITFFWVTTRGYGQ